MNSNQNTFANFRMASAANKISAEKPAVTLSDIWTGAGFKQVNGAEEYVRQRLGGIRAVLSTAYSKLACAASEYLFAGWGCDGQAPQDPYQAMFCLPGNGRPVYGLWFPTAEDDLIALAYLGRNARIAGGITASLTSRVLTQLVDKGTISKGTAQRIRQELQQQLSFLMPTGNDKIN